MREKGRHTAQRGSTIRSFSVTSAGNLASCEDRRSSQDILDTFFREGFERGKRSVNDLLTKKWYLDGPSTPDSTWGTLPSA